MNSQQAVKMDERTVAVQNASYKWAYYFLGFSLVIDTYYRQHVRNEAVGDLVALVCIGGAIGMVYQVIYKGWVSYWPWGWRKTAIVLAGFILLAVLLWFVLVVGTFTRR